MLRRTSFLVAGGALLPTLISAAQAQTAASSSAAMSPNDIHMMAITASAFSLNGSRMAERKASAAPVRLFGQLEAEEQEAAMAAMRLAGVSIPAQVPMPADKMRMSQELEAASGAEFDRAYLRAQKMGHEELLAIHQRIAQGGSSPAEKIIGTLSVPAIKTHLAMIDMIMQAR
jgi:putative membrane protein